METKDYRSRKQLLAEIAELRQAQQVAHGQMDALTRTLRAHRAEPDLDKLLGQVLIAITEQLQASSSTLWLYDLKAETITLQLVYETGQVLSPEQAGYPSDARILSLAECSPAWKEVYLRRLPHVFEDMAEVPIFSPTQQRYLQELGVRALLSVPLVLGDQAIGSFNVRLKEERPFRPEELELAQALAHQATLALQMTRLADQAKQTAVFEERSRMALEIHDTLAQAFTGIVLQLEAASRFLSAKPDLSRSCLTRARDLAREGLAEARRSVTALQPEAARYRDLLPTLTQVVKEMTTATPVHVDVCVQGAPYLLPPDVGLNLLRIGQEALSNALQHGQALEVRLELTYEPGRIGLRVQDNGQGFDPHQGETGGFGLLGMQKRAERMGGQWSLQSQPGQGTEVKVIVPLSFPTARQE